MTFLSEKYCNMSFLEALQTLRLPMCIGTSDTIKLRYKRSDAIIILYLSQKYIKI